MVTPSSVTSDMEVREFFQMDSSLNNINNTIDGNLTTGIVTEIANGEVTYFFSPVVDGASGFSIWNNAGFLFHDGESIGMLDIEVFDAMNNSLYADTDVTIPEGPAGDPFTIDFGGLLNGVASVHLRITANNGATANLDGTAWREVAINCVPEPASLGLLGALALAPLVRRRRG
jgi:hypothetical protein